MALPPIDSSASLPHEGGRKKRRPRPASIGLPPGTLVLDAEAYELQIRLMRYDDQHLEEIEVLGLDGLEQELARVPPGGTGVLWVDVTGHGDVERLTRLGKLLGLHPLALEDVVNSYQRPKVDTFEGGLFIVARMIDEGTPVELRLETEQLGIWLRPGLVATFQERPGDCFGPVRQRLRGGNPRFRTQGADYLTYAILDAVVDRYMVLADRYREALEGFEDRLLGTGTDVEPFSLDRLYHLRRDLVHLGRSAAPLRDVLMALLRTEDRTLIRPETILYLRDCYDHALRVVDWIESHRDFAASLMEVHLSMLGNRTNEAMKVLTIISTIFIPLSFVAGVYGMNFDPDASPYNMPELRAFYGYPIALASMLVVAVALLWYVRRKRWL